VIFINSSTVCITLQPSLTHVVDVVVNSQSACSAQVPHATVTTNDHDQDHYHDEVRTLERAAVAPPLAVVAATLYEIAVAAAAHGKHVQLCQ